MMTTTNWPLPAGNARRRFGGEPEGASSSPLSGIGSPLLLPPTATLAGARAGAGSASSSSSEIGSALHDPAISIGVCFMAGTSVLTVVCFVLV